MPAQYSEALWGEAPHRIYVRSRDDGDEAILLLHGLGCSSTSYRAIWNSELFADLSIYAIDWLGFGGSEKPRDFSYRLDDHAQILSKFIQSLSYKKLHIVAHSMGSAIALLLEEKIQAHFESFVCAEGVLIGEDCDVSRMTSSVSFESFRDDVLPTLLDLENSGELGTDLKYSDPEGYHMSAASLVAWADSGRLLRSFRDLAKKKFYLYGSKNISKPVLARLETISKISIESAGHFMMNDNPNEFYKIIAECLSE